MSDINDSTVSIAMLGNREATQTIAGVVEVPAPMETVNTSHRAHLLCSTMSCLGYNIDRHWQKSIPQEPRNIEVNTSIVIPMHHTELYRINSSDTVTRVCW